MRSLKRRPRSDSLVNQERRTGGLIGRLVYLSLLAVFALGIGNYFWGDFLFLRGKGIVLQEQTVSATTYIARVVEVSVVSGQKVKKGDPLLRVESTDVLERLADLSIRQAELTQRAAEFNLRSQIALQLLPLAEQREQETGKMLSQLHSMSDRGLLTSARYEEALRANYDASGERVRLTAESDTLHSQITALDRARQNANIAVKNLGAHYANGIIRAEVDGTVGVKVPAVGDVHRPGESFLSVFGGRSYVLAYLPNRYLFSITPGTKVTISGGRSGQQEGTILEILPVTDALPLEFQNTFRPRERSQLAKIELPHGADFPIFEKVSITRAYY
ncbi:MAG: biotin/lipoyl-binding protein [Rhodobiaceae bacterium]|nr:biotin/lipoyl-binding protein [Rhodobiaceae bacterium]